MRRSLFSAALTLAILTSPAIEARDAAPVLESPPQRVYAPPMTLRISREQAAKVARQVWLNETGGKRDMITAWNATEDFASVGIGHFIWFSEGLETRFAQSFPAMFNFLRENGASPPAWLDKHPVPHSPWKTKAQFDREFHRQPMTELRQFLLRTMDLQTQYLVRRLEDALPKILADIADADQRMHVRDQFARVVAASPDLYPLIDYVNFKGEGIVDSETFPNRKTGVREGWGLKHVLLNMKGTSPDQEAVLGEFSQAARFVLLRRIANNPPNRRWQRGWMKRVDTYKRPLR